MSKKSIKYLCTPLIAVLLGTSTAVVLTGRGRPVFSQGLSDGEQGTLEVRVKDHREAIADFSKLEILVDTIRIAPKADLKFWQIGWKDLRPSLEKIDLTQYTGKHSATIFRGAVTQGTFGAIELKLKGVEGILKKTRSKVPVKNLLRPIKLPFSTHQKEVTSIVLDLTVMDMSDHPPKGYELHIKGYELYANGKLIEKVPPG
jgi:hypothetical protein